MALWSRLATFVTGGAVARAASDGVSPVLEPVRQHAWQQNQLKVLDPMAAARLRVQGLITDAEAVEEASRSGIGANRLAALEALIASAPPQGELGRMLNRHTIKRDDFDAAMAKHEIPPKWWDALYDLTHEKLDPVQLANAIHRGLVDDPGLLAVPAPTGTGNVPAYPVYPIDALDEAKAAGLDRTRLGVLVGLMGLPMGVHEAANAVFRKIINKTDFQRAVAEGNTRNEWGEAIFEQSRQIPTARDFLENALRGYRDLQHAIEGAALHGMTPEHATLIYQNQGRPMNVRQITQALARGGIFKPEPGELTDPYEASIVEGSIKPAYYDLSKALRYTLPSVFAIRGLATSGVWDFAKTRERLLWWGWIPEDATDVARAWTGAHAGGGKELVKAELLDEFEGGFITESELRDHLAALGYQGAELDLEVHLGDARRIKGWRDKAVTALNKAYLKSTMTREAAATDLTRLGVTDADTQTRILDIWDIERSF